MADNKQKIPVEYVILTLSDAELRKNKLEQIMLNESPTLFRRIENRNNIPSPGDHIDHKYIQHDSVLMEEQGFPGDLRGKYRVVASIIYEGLGLMSKVGIVKVN